MLLLYYLLISILSLINAEEFIPFEIGTSQNFSLTAITIDTFKGNNNGMKYELKYGENDNQKYYDVTVGKDYLCVFANKWNPNTWLGSYNSICIHNKTKNDRVRKKQGLAKSCHPSELREDFMLCSANPEYMMKKVEYCYKHGLMEISQ